MLIDLINVIEPILNSIVTKPYVVTLSYVKALSF
jgi:hypothetical protein